MIDEKKLASATMNGEELDNVAGGFIVETSTDSRLLYAYGLLDDFHRTTHTMFHVRLVQ